MTKQKKNKDAIDSNALLDLLHQYLDCYELSCERCDKGNMHLECTCMENNEARLEAFDQLISGAKRFFHDKRIKKLQ